MEASDPMDTSICHPRHMALVCFVLALVLLDCTSAMAQHLLRLGWTQGGELIGEESTAKSFADYLSARLNVKVIPVETRDLERLSHGIKAGKIDLAVIPNYLYPGIAERTRLLASPEIGGSRFMQLYVLVSRSSGITSLKQLRGRKAAGMPEQSRLKCNFLSASVGISATKYFKEVKQYMEIRDAVYSVVEGRTDATCISSSLYDLLIKFDPSLLHKLRIIKKSPVYPLHPFLASIKTPAWVSGQVTAVLKNMKNDYAAQYILMKMGIQGFGPPVEQIGLYPVESKILADRTSNRTKRAAARPSATIKTVKVRKKKHAADKTKLAKTKTAVKKKVETGTGKTRTQPKIKKEKGKSKGTSKGQDEKSRRGSGKVVRHGANTTGKKVEKEPEDKSGQQATTSQIPVEAEMKDVTRQTTNSSASVRKERPYARHDGLQSGHGSTILDNLGYLGRGAFMLLFAILGGFVLKLVRGYRKKQSVTILTREDDKVVAVSLALVKGDRLEVKSCSAEPLRDCLDDNGVRRKWLKNAGYVHGMKLIGVVLSDRTRVLYYILPILKQDELIKALKWRLEEDNVPYIAEQDEIRPVILERDKKSRKMTVLVQIFNKEETAWLRPENEWLVDSLMSLEVCLIGCFSHSGIQFEGKRTGLVYRLSDSEAVIIIHDYRREIFSRRLYAVRRHGLQDTDSLQEGSPAALWLDFLQDIKHTLKFYYDRSNSLLDVLYFAGEGVPQDDPDPDSFLANELEVKVMGVDFLANVKDRQDLLSSCLRSKFMVIGAANVWFGRK